MDSQFCPPRPSRCWVIAYVARCVHVTCVELLVCWRRRRRLCRQRWQQSDDGGGDSGPGLRPRSGGVLHRHEGDRQRLVRHRLPGAPLWQRRAGRHQEGAAGQTLQGRSAPPVSQQPSVIVHLDNWPSKVLKKKKITFRDNIRWCFTVCVVVDSSMCPVIHHRLDFFSPL